MIQVELADPAITVHNWPREMDKIGQYTLKLRKTPEEMKAEREHLKRTYGATAKKVNPIKYESGTCIERDAEDPSTVYFLPGLWPRIKGYMEANGLEYEIIADNRNPDIRPPIDYEAIKDVQFRETQDLALALIATSDGGVIEALPGYGKTVCMGVICKAFPTLRILITTDSIAVVETAYRYLVERLPGEVGILTGKRDTSTGKRVVVCTAKSISKIKPELVDLLLIDEAHFLSAGVTSQEIMKFCFCRKFGFTATPYRGDGSQIIMESIVGPTILKMDYDEGVDLGMVVPMKYAMLHCGWVPSICQKDDVADVVLKRYAYWRNTARNKAIADFVYKFHKVAPDAQILIICQTLEHCLALHAMLPFFKVLYYGATDMNEMARRFPKDKYPNLDLSQYKMTQKQLEIGRAAFAKGTLKWVISTLVLKQGVSANHLRLLIRCDGATSKIMGIQIPGRLSRLDEGKDFGYLVDVDDTGCAWTRRRASIREQLYQEQGWTKIQPEDIINDFAGNAAASNSSVTDDSGTKES